MVEIWTILWVQITLEKVHGDEIVTWYCCISNQSVDYLSLLQGFQSINKSVYGKIITNVFSHIFVDDNRTFISKFSFLKGRHKLNFSRCTFLLLSLASLLHHIIILYLYDDRFCVTNRWRYKKKVVTIYSFSNFFTRYLTLL